MAMPASACRALQRHAAQSVDISFRISQWWRIRKTIPISRRWSGSPSKFNRLFFGLYIGWSDVTYLWSQCYRHFVGQHVVLCAVKWWRFVALFE